MKRKEKEIFRVHQKLKAEILSDELLELKLNKRTTSVNKIYKYIKYSTKRKEKEIKNKNI